MIETVFNDFGTIFSSIWEWITSLNQKIPFLDIALGLFLVSTIMRFIVFPMLKPRGSDSVKRKDKEVKENG